MLIEHAFIIAGGEITKFTRNWIGNKLDAIKRSQIMFIDRDDLLNLFIVTYLAVPGSDVMLASSIEDDDSLFNREMLLEEIV